MGKTHGFPVVLAFSGIHLGAKRLEHTHVWGYVSPFLRVSLLFSGNCRKAHFWFEFKAGGIKVLKRNHERLVFYHFETRPAFALRL